MSNTDNIKVTVVMPIYNAYDYLRPAMDSVIYQTLKEVEIICIDDGSTDHSLDIIKEYQKADPRIRIVTENNAGPSLARNKGLARARGEYVIFLDADDFYEPNLLESLYDLAVANELDIALTDYDIYNNRKATFVPMIRSEHDHLFDGGKVISKNEYPDQIFQSITNYVWNKMFRREFLREKNLCFNEQLNVFEDVYFVMSAMSLAARVGKIKANLIHHRVYSQQQKNKLFKKYYAQVPKLYLSLKEFLMHNGMYVPLSQSFLNLSASRCYKIYNVLWKDAKEELWNLLHNEYSEKLGWHAAAVEDFENEEVRDFIASVIMYNHKQEQKRRDKGLKVRIERVGNAIKNMQFKKKLRTLFKKKEK